VTAGADSAAARRAMTRLALAYHPDAGDPQGQMIRINVAYEAAQFALPGAF
jgi:DnaJ-class molecular chaperone